MSRVWNCAHILKWRGAISENIELEPPRFNMFMFCTNATNNQCCSAHVVPYRTMAAAAAGLSYNLRRTQFVCGFGRNSELLAQCRRRGQQSNRFVPRANKRDPYCWTWVCARPNYYSRMARMNIANRRTWVQLHLIIIMIMSRIYKMRRSIILCGFRSCLERILRITRRDNAIDTWRKVWTLWWHLYIHRHRHIVWVRFDWRTIGGFVRLTSNKRHASNKECSCIIIMALGTSAEMRLPARLWTTWRRAIQRSQFVSVLCRSSKLALKCE